MIIDVAIDQTRLRILNAEVPRDPYFSCPEANLDSITWGDPLGWHSFFATPLTSENGQPVFGGSEV